MKSKVAVSTYMRFILREWFTGLKSEITPQTGMGISKSNQTKRDR